MDYQLCRESVPLTPALFKDYLYIQVLFYIQDIQVFLKYIHCIFSSVLRNFPQVFPKVLQKYTWMCYFTTALCSERFLWVCPTKHSRLLPETLTLTFHQILFSSDYIIHPRKKKKKVSKLPIAPMDNNFCLP